MVANNENIKVCSKCNTEDSYYYSFKDDICSLERDN